MKTRILIILLCNLTLTLGCSLDEHDYEKKEKVEIIQLFVGSEIQTMDAYGTKSVPCISVEENNVKFLLPHTWIEGFEYEEGYEYTLKVKKITPPYEIYDAPQSFYYLLEMISKKQ